VDACLTEQLVRILGRAQLFVGGAEDVDLWRARDILADLQLRRIIVKTSEAERGPNVEYGPGPSFPRKRKSRAAARRPPDGSPAPQDEG